MNRRGPGGVVRVMTVSRAVAAVPVLLLALGVLVGPSARPAHACSCAGLPSAEQYRRADAVFTGVAVEHLDTNPDGPTFSSLDPIVWTFEVEAVRKGRVPEEVEVVTARSGASCGYAFEEGRRYQVFARREGSPAPVAEELGEGHEAGLSSGLCDGNRDLTAGGEALRAGSPRTPHPGGAVVDEPGPPPPGLGSLALPLGPLGLAFGSVLVGMGYHHASRPKG